jgi:hypothetical protein
MSRNVWWTAVSAALAFGFGPGVEAQSKSACTPAAVAALQRAGADADAADGEAALRVLREAHAAEKSCLALATASWAWQAWLSAGRAMAQGATSDALAPVREALGVLEPAGKAAGPEAAYAAAIAHAAAAGAQYERDEMRVWLEHAAGLARRLPPGTRPWPLAPAVAEGELWLRLQDPALADAAFSRALEDAETPVALRGLARARASGANMAGGCEPFKRALRLVEAQRSDGPLAVEARAFLRLCR